MPVDYNKMLEDLIQGRKNRRTITSVRPSGTASLVANFDFASLYPSSMTVIFPGRRKRRMNKIKKIFHERRK